MKPALNKPALNLLGLTAACAACCALPAMGPVLAGLGLGGLATAAFGWGAALTILTVGAGVGIAMTLRRRSPARSPAAGAPAQSCRNCLPFETRENEAAVQVTATAPERAREAADLLFAQRASGAAIPSHPAKDTGLTLDRRSALVGIALGLVGGTMPARAAERMSFNATAFQAAQEAGRPIVVHITAPWCETCQVQKPVVALLADRPEFKSLAIFDVDFDTQRDALRTLNVRTQSTFVVFKGKTEVARSVGETRMERIESLMRTAL